MNCSSSNVPLLTCNVSAYSGIVRFVPVLRHNNSLIHRFDRYSKLLFRLLFFHNWTIAIPSFLDAPSHHHHHQSLNREGRLGTTDNFATSFLHFPLFSTALWDLPDSRPVHSLMLSSHLFLCPPCLLPPFTVPCKMVLARPDERKT